MPRDSVDALLDSWAQRRPELEFSPVAVLTRLARVRRHLDIELEGVFARHGLEPATFALLATADRLDAAGEGLSRARLMEELGLPAAALDSALDSLVSAGLLEEAGPGYALTAAGRSAMAVAVPEHLANADRLLSALSTEDRETLATVLRRLLVEFEGSRPVDGAPGQLGVTLMPAHVTAELRAAVELPPATGLLVRGVERNSAAARAGLRHGDILVSAGGRALRAVEDLYASLAGRRELEVRALRGTEPVVVTVVPDGPAPAAASPGRAAYAEHVV
jgi:DNA-binding MarR family transcriptional regulator